MIGRIGVAALFLVAKVPSIVLEPVKAIIVVKISVKVKTVINLTV